MLFFQNSCKLFRFSEIMFQKYIQAYICRILLCVIVSMSFPDYGYTQTPIFVETFGNTFVGGCDQGNPAHNYVTSNGTWTVTLFGINDTAANVWYISATEPGLPVGSCAVPGCHTNPVYTDRTLHIGNVDNSPNAAILCPNGDCGAVYDAGGFQNAVQTNARAESPPFAMTGQTQNLLVFNFIENADGNLFSDDMQVEFFDGSTWLPAIADSLRSQNTCGAASYQWEQFSILLPSVSANIPNAKIGFRWVNDNGGQGTNPSVAIDSIIVFQLGAPVANISASDTDICVNDCIDFFADSVGPVASYLWTFPGASVSSSSQRNPTGICYPNPGTYIAKMVVSTGGGIDSATITIVVNPCTVPTADFTVSDSVICEMTCTNFTDLSTDGPTQWFWSFPGGVPVSSTSPTPPQICYLTPGFYDVTLIVFNQYGSDTLTKTTYMQVDTCPKPIADFYSVPTSFCPQKCVQFTDSSQNGPILSYDWYFPGATPDHDTSASPTVCYEFDGQYDVQLVVTNQYGSDTIYKYSEVSVSYIPNAIASPDTSMRFGESYHMFASGGASYIWSPATGLDSATSSNPIATPKKTTTYTVLITDSSGCTAIRQVTITILQDNNLFVPNSFSPNGDGSNDKVFVRGNNLYGLRLTIFDRWGEKVFETTDQNSGWDGTYKGEELDPGVFTYVVTVNYENKETQTLSGTITLIR